jgi:hypothetical protein
LIDPTLADASRSRDFFNRRAGPRCS